MSVTDVSFPTAEELGPGLWGFDKMHAPRPITPLSFDLVIYPMAEGFTQAQAEYDNPFAAAARDIHHYFYFTFHRVTEDVARDRPSRYGAALAEKVPLIGRRWDEEWKPAVIRMNEPKKHLDYTGMTDEELVAKLDEFAEHIRFQWWIHGHINFVLLSSSAFCDMYDELLQPDDPTESYRALQGFPTRSVDVSRAIWKLSRIVKQSRALSVLFREEASSDVLTHLGESADGRAFRLELDEFLEEFGWRADAVYDLADVSWREDPSIALASIAAFADLDDSQDPDVLYRKAVGERESLLAKARAALEGDDEALARFEALYEAARYSFPVTEDHAFYIDQLGIGVLRRFALVIGARLVEKDVIEAVDDMFFLRRHELVDALLDGVDRRVVVADRRSTFDAATGLTPPQTIGVPEPGDPDPFYDAVVVRLLGAIPPSEVVDPLVLTAVAGSPGVVTGTARCGAVARGGE